MVEIRSTAIRQEIVLGIGGVRVLRALGIQPTVFHANEGHTAFMLLERARELVQQGQTFEEAAEQIRATSLFTTHTPVPAGHDAFPLHMMEKHFAGFWDDLAITKQEFMESGAFRRFLQHDGSRAAHVRVAKCA